MKSVQFTFSCGMRLVYDLHPSWTAGKWLDLLCQAQPRFLHQTALSGSHGFSNSALIEQRMAELRMLTRDLGYEPMPALTSENWREVLNVAHLPFPEPRQGAFSFARREKMHQMNLLIHWLEYELANRYGAQQYLLNLDFNHHAPTYRMGLDIPPVEYPNFSPQLEFGTLHLHYTHIGKHFLEMALANDLVAPAAHFKAQRLFNASCGLVFSEPQETSAVTAQLTDYYARRGGQAFFGYALEDPALAPGFFKLGRLRDFADYASKDQRAALRNKLQTSSPVAWAPL